VSKNLKILMTLFCFLTFSSFAEVSDQEKIKKEIMGKFQQLFELKLGQGDKTAKELSQKAAKNAGQINLEMEEVKKIMLKWDSSGKTLFKGLATKEEKLNEIKEEFETLLRKKVQEADPQALHIAEKGELNNGKVELTVRQMRELISKWEK